MLLKIIDLQPKLILFDCTLPYAYSMFYPKPVGLIKKDPIQKQITLKMTLELKPITFYFFFILLLFVFLSKYYLSNIVAE